MGCPHGDVSGECARNKDAHQPPIKEDVKAKATGKLRATDHGQSHVGCKLLQDAIPSFRVVRVHAHKTRLACLNCGKEQTVSIKFAEEDVGQHNTVVNTATPRSKRKWDWWYRR